MFQREHARRFWLLPSLLLIVFAATGASAEVVVRSGEHPGRSRLVMDFDRLPKWQLEPRPNGYELRLDPWDDAILLDDLFYYIPRTRLADLRIDFAQRRIFLEIGCDCPVEASVARNRSLVIDIRDADPDRDLEVSSIAAMTDGPIFLLAGTNEDRAPDTPAADEPPEFSAVPKPQPSEPVLPFSGSDIQGTELLDDSLTRTLAEELARAAAQGMVDAESDLWKAEGAKDVKDPSPTGNALEEALPKTPNVRIRTGSEDPIDPNAAAELPAIDPQPQCPEPWMYAAENWSDGSAFHLQVGAFRATLVGEFDRVDRRAALGLARLYVHYGFGAEARAIVRQFIPDDSAAQAVIPLSHLIESGSISGSLVGFGQCGGSLPLWAMLDEDPEAPLPPIRSEAILLAFSGLPPHLRRYLGYRVAARFAARGDFSSAEIVRAALARISDPDDPALILSTTQTTEIEEIEQDVESALADLAISLQPEAAEALVLSIDGHLAREERVPLDLIDTAAALAFELGDHPERRRVKSAEIRAHFANYDFDRGFDELQLAQRADALSAEQKSEAWEMGFERLLRKSEDAEFVGRMFGEEAVLGNEYLSDALKLALAERLLGLGFPRGASALAPAGSTGEDGLFQARLALAEGDVDRALAVASARDDREAMRFAAELLDRVGRHGDAQDIFAALDSNERAGAQAWKAGDWARIAETTGGRADAAQQMLGALSAVESGPPVAEGPPTIARSQRLVDESAGLRATLDALLAEEPTLGE